MFYLVKRVADIKNRPRLPVPDEDPYSVALSGSGSSGSSSKEYSSNGKRGDKPPKLPPRHNAKGFNIPMVSMLHFNLTVVW